MCITLRRCLVSGPEKAGSSIPCPLNAWDAIQAIEGGTRGTRCDALRLGVLSGTRRGWAVPLSREPCMMDDRTAKRMSDMTRHALIDSLMSANSPWAGSRQADACGGSGGDPYEHAVDGPSR